MKRLKELCLLGVLITSCAVEVGNPTTQTDQSTKEGKAVISIAGEGASELGSSLQLNIDSIELRGYDSQEAFVSYIDLELTSVDLTSSDEAIVIASSDAIREGVYDQIIITLSEDQPILLTDNTNTQRTVSFEDPSYRAFYVNDNSFQVEEGKEVQIFVNLDAENSLEKSGDNYIFKPRANTAPIDFIGAYRNVLPADFPPGMRGVCAYAYDGIKPPSAVTSTRPDGLRQPPDGIKPPPPGVGISPRKIFPDKASVVKDPKPPCYNAIAKVMVVEGRYVFPYLPPATYDFRFFAPGVYREGPQGVKIAPGEKVDGSQTSNLQSQPSMPARQRR